MRKNKRYNEYDTLLEGGAKDAKEEDKKSEGKKEDDDDPYAEPI